MKKEMNWYECVNNGIAGNFVIAFDTSGSKADSALYSSDGSIEKNRAQGLTCG